MRIVAGTKEIPLKDMVYREQVTVNEKVCDGLRVYLDGPITEEDITTILNTDWDLMDGEGYVESYSGYNTLASHELVIAKVQTKQEEITDALMPVLEKLTDEQASEFVTLFPVWIPGKKYKPGDRFSYEDILYKVISATEIIADNAYPPDVAVSLYTKILTSPTGEILPWEQPESTNPYMIGDRVTHNGKTWESNIDYNVFEPGVAGWDEVV